MNLYETCVLSSNEIVSITSVEFFEDINELSSCELFGKYEDIIIYFKKANNIDKELRKKLTDYKNEILTHMRVFTYLEDVLIGMNDNF